MRRKIVLQSSDALLQRRAVHRPIQINQIAQEAPRHALVAQIFIVSGYAVEILPHVAIASLTIARIKVALVHETSAVSAVEKATQSFNMVTDKLICDRRESTRQTDKIVRVVIGPGVPNDVGPIAEHQIVVMGLRVQETRILHRVHTPLDLGNQTVAHAFRKLP